MTKQEALQFFWSQFGVPAYEENSVPDTADIDEGYITYQKIEGEFEEPIFPTGSIWTRGDSWRRAEGIKDAIDDNLKRGGQIIKIDGGRLWIQRGSPFAQGLADTDKTIRRYVINLAMEFMTE